MTLGYVKVVKIRVRVTDVEPTWSIAETYETTGGLLFVTNPVRTLSTDDAIAAGREVVVKRGDPVRQIVKDSDTPSE